MQASASTSVARAAPNAAAVQKQLGTTFDVDQSRYVLLKSAGKGAFGTVAAARDNSRNGETVAIKKILRVFENSTAARRVLREIKFMRHMRHPNVRSVFLLFSNVFLSAVSSLHSLMGLGVASLSQLISARDFPIPQSLLDPRRVLSPLAAAPAPEPLHPVLPTGMPMTPVTQEDLESLYLVSDFMDADLNSVINSSQTLGDKYVQFFILQMMRGLAHMHSCKCVVLT